MCIMRLLQILTTYCLIAMPAICLGAAPGSTIAPQEDPVVNSSLTASKPLQQYQQGLNYLLGRNGVTRSTEKAAQIFKSLAEQNWSSAQHMLGNMYMNGKGVEKNDLLAYKWLSLASKSNIRLAESIHNKRSKLYNRLQNSLSPQALNKVDNWIAEWQPSSKQGLAIAN